MTVRALAGRWLLLVSLCAAPSRGWAEDEPPTEAHGKGGDGDGRKTVDYAAGKGLQLTTKDGKASLQVGAWVQPVLTILRGVDPTRPVASLHRARLELDATLPHGLELAFGIGFQEKKVEVLDAYVAWRPVAELDLAVGHLKAPWGQERLVGVRNLPMLDRGAPSVLDAGRNLGFRVRGRLLDGKLRLVLAAMRGPGSADFADERNVDLVGRLAVVPAEAVAFSVHGALLARPLGIGTAVSDVASGAGLDLWSWLGVGGHFGADAALVVGPLRVLGEGAVVVEGEALGAPGERGILGAAQVLLGIAPGADRESAWDGGAVRKGVEGLARADFVLWHAPRGNGLTFAQIRVQPGLVFTPWPQLSFGGAPSFTWDQAATTAPVQVGANFWITAGL